MDVFFAGKQSLSINNIAIRELDILQMSNVELCQYLYNLSMYNPLIKLKEPDSEIFDYEYNFDNISYSKSIFDDISDQLRFALHNELDIKLAEYLIKFVDDKGYFIGDINEIAGEFDFYPEFIYKLLFKLQNILEPVGIFARDFKEHMLIQIDRSSSKNKSELSFLIDDLQYIAEYKISILLKKYNISLDAFNYLLKELKQFTPYPLYGLNCEDMIYNSNRADLIVIYDTHLEKDITLNENVIPVLSVNSDLLEEWNRLDKCSFISNCLNEAKEVVRSVRKRNDSLLNVAKCIFSYQREFFLSKCNVPLSIMTLSDIAKKLGVHNSTVSRAIKDKYISTNKGLLKIKDLFSRNVDDDFNSQSYIKNIINDLIASESSILSDTDIVKKLHDRGISIGRCTVRNYRNELGIPSSYLRQRKKNLMLQE